MPTNQSLWIRATVGPAKPQVAIILQQKQHIISLITGLRYVNYHHGTDSRRRLTCSPITL